MRHLAIEKKSARAKRLRSEINKKKVMEDAENLLKPHLLSFTEDLKDYKQAIRSLWINTPYHSRPSQSELFLKAALNCGEFYDALGEFSLDIIDAGFQPPKEFRVFLRKVVLEGAHRPKDQKKCLKRDGIIGYAVSELVRKHSIAAAMNDGSNHESSACHFVSKALKNLGVSLKYETVREIYNEYGKAIEKFSNKSKVLTILNPYFYM